MALITRPIHRSFTPLLQILEARAVPSASITAIGNKLEIQGDSVASLISIRTDGKGNYLMSNATGVPPTFPAAT